MGYETQISWRHLRSKKRQAFLSAITYISLGGVALGVATLVVVLSVWTGYENTIKERILGINSHIVVLKYGPGFTEYRQARETTLKVPGVVAASPFTLRECMLASETSMAGALVKAVDPATAASATLLERNVEAGEGKLDWLYHPETMPLNAETPRPTIILGTELARDLEVGVGDEVEWISPMGGGLGPSGPIPTSETVRVAGLFHAGMYEYDNKFAYVTLAAAQAFFDMPDEVSGLDVRVADLDDARPIAGALLEKLGGYPYRTRDWMEMNRNLLSALQLEKMVSSILLLFIILVAAFNIVSTLILMVLEKGKEIAILKAMGATDGGVMRIFVMQGTAIGLAGTTLGLVLGYVLCIGARTLNIGIDPSVYYLAELPVEVRLQDLAVIAAVALSVSLLATLLPSWKAARMLPADGVRYE